MISTGVPWPSLINSAPGAPGRRRSLTIRSNVLMVKRSCASCTEPASLTWYWLRSSRRRKAERIMVSSSTIKMCGIDSILSTVSVHSGRRFDMTRQGHPDTGAALALCVSRAVDGDLSIMLFNDGIDQCKAQTGTFTGVLGGEEGFEQAVLDVLWNAAAFVLHDQVDRVLESLALDAYRTAGRGRVAGVRQQVDQHLRQAPGGTREPHGA